MQRMTALAKLRRFLHRRLDVERTGGVFFARDDYTLILADTSAFTSAHAKLIEAVFPHVIFSVVACDSSASGFIVIFNTAQDDRTWRRAGIRLVLHLMCFVVCMHTARA
jgi:hypothetical protein